MCLQPKLARMSVYAGYEREKEIYDFIDEIQNYELPPHTRQLKLLTCLTIIT